MNPILFDLCFPSDWPSVDLNTVTFASEVILHKISYTSVHETEDTQNKLVITIFYKGLEEFLRHLLVLVMVFSFFFCLLFLLLLLLLGDFRAETLHLLKKSISIGSAINHIVIVPDSVLLSVFMDLVKPSSHKIKLTMLNLSNVQRKVPPTSDFKLDLWEN